MRYDAEIRIYDCLDLLALQSRVWATDGMLTGTPDLVLEETRTLRGVGRTHVCAWLADALQPFVEDLWTCQCPPQRDGHGR